MPIEYNQTGVTYDAAAYTYNGDPYVSSIFPVVGVYIAFDDGPYVASPAWTEVTQYVRSVSTRRRCTRSIRATGTDPLPTRSPRRSCAGSRRRAECFVAARKRTTTGLT